jgi:uncharacterized protein YqeY
MQRRKDRPKIALLRNLVAAFDNAEARHAAAGPAPGEDFCGGVVEVERLTLHDREVRCVLSSEVKEREDAAARFEATIVRQYLE